MPKTKEKNILKKIKENSNKKFKEIKKILDIKNNYDIKLVKEKFEMEIFEGDNKIISGNFKFLGIVDKDGVFYWPYMIPSVDKRIINDIEKIKSSKYLFQGSDNRDMMLFNSILSQDSIKLNMDEIDKLNDLLLYLSDGIYFFNTIHKSGNIQLLSLSNINEKFV